MRDYITLGPTPSDEECAQVGTDNYSEQSRRECNTYVKQLERQFPTMPDGAYFTVKSFPHDFGTYREVVVNFDADDEEATKFAFEVENNSPANWDDEAKASLGIK